ncbi:hypothetical protein [Legionella feeleii]|nr:hypothetical protein [Legionella feeleii]SPX59935.1 efflux transporter, RND family, MFP subunit [Legionella feeleii]
MSALFRDEENWAVYVVKGHRAYKKRIIIKHPNPDQAVIESGLESGDEVILYPSSLIHEGVLIKQ